MRNKKWVPHGKAAIAGSGHGRPHKSRGKWWNPPSPSPVKDLDKIIKELENK
jgi:hypothetical protein